MIKECVDRDVGSYSLSNPKDFASRQVSSNTDTFRGSYDKGKPNY